MNLRTLFPYTISDKWNKYPVSQGERAEPSLRIICHSNIKKLKKRSNAQFKIELKSLVVFFYSNASVV